AFGAGSGGGKTREGVAASATVPAEIPEIWPAQADGGRGEEDQRQPQRKGPESSKWWIGAGRYGETPCRHDMPAAYLGIRRQRVALDGATREIPVSDLPLVPD